MKRFFKRCDEHPIELTSAEITLNPDKVIDMLANLAQRIVELERKINDMNVTLERIEHVNDRQNDEIDTLHANQRKLAEDTTNRLDHHSERIRELAEMIGERKPYFKTFKPEIHFRIDNDKTPEDLAKSILKALEEVGRR
jgi:TolA-binding protein